MDDSIFQRLLERVKSDRAFALQLIFEPRKALEELGYLSAEDKARIAGLTPESALGAILDPNRLKDCTVTVQCGETCTHTSSSLFEHGDRVVNPGSEVAECGVTVVCGSTCTHTASRLGDERINPANVLGAAIRGRLAGR